MIGMKEIIVLGIVSGLPICGSAVLIEEPVPVGKITVTASSTFGPSQDVNHLINGAGMEDDRHDNHGSADTMWHTIEKPPATTPADGLPAATAWVRFEFDQPVPCDTIRIWNHNQAGLTDRGFQRARILTSADGATWSAQAVVIPRAPGAPEMPCSLAVKVAGPIKAAVIAADSNYGSDYHGLSAVRFVSQRDVPEADLPVPTAIECVPQPAYGHRADGKAGREIRVALRGAKLYGAAQVDVNCDGIRETTSRPADPEGTSTFSLLLPAAVTNACTAKIALRTGATTLEETIRVPETRRWVIYVLMHSHVDIGYTQVQPVIEKQQAENVFRALELFKQNPDLPAGAKFKWNLETYWVVDQFLRVATPAQVVEFHQAVRDGLIGIDAMYGNLLTGLCRPEEMLRQFGYATAMGRRCGVAVDSMMISDVPGLTWGIVPALAHSGVKYISDGPNGGDRIGYVRVQWENHPFWWESPSGKERALYWGAQGGYSIGHGYGGILSAWKDLAKQLESAQYPYDIVQLRWSKGDNGPADTGVMPAVRDWNAKYAYPKFIIATTREAFHAFEERYGGALPTYRGDMTPYWEDGAGSSSRETGMNRQSADRLLQAETLWALLNPVQYPAAEFDRVWKFAAMYSEHTWGAHNSISQPDLPFVTEQWKYKRGYALAADEGSRKLLAQILPAGNARTFDVFNTTSWPRTDLATLPKETEGDTVKDEAGQAVPSQRLSTGELVFLAKDVPAFGAKRFTVTAGAGPGTGGAHADGPTLGTAMFSVRLDEASGDIVSLRRTGWDVEWAKGPINNYLYLPGGNVNDAKPSGPATIRIKERGPLVASVLVESDAPGCNKLTREVRVVDGLDRVELIDNVDKQAIRAVEGVHLGFGFNVPNPVVRVNSPGAVAQIEKDQLPGACKNWYSVERWVDISNDKYGVTWSTIDAPLMEVGALTANLPRGQGNPNAYMKTITPSAQIYSWVMNNHWHTNYRADQDGPTWFRYAIRPHAGYDSVAAMRFGIESSMPLIAAPATGKTPGTLLEIEPASVMATALKPSDDGQAIIVRLFGASGKDEQAQVTWATPMRVTLSDGSEQPGKPVTARIKVPAWGLVTLRAEKK
jgi:alpha-mannosidase